MKRKSVFLTIAVLSLFVFKSFSQSENYSFIPSTRLAVTYNKTTNLVFPFSVQSIDRGSKDILVQQPKGTENIVQVKADKPNFTQTNLSVITVDGKLYSFTVDYTAQPVQLNIIIQDRSDSMLNGPVTLSSGNKEAQYAVMAQKIMEGTVVHGKKDRSNQMELQLNGIYINDDVLYFRLRLKNRSNVSYDASHISFSIIDKQKAKRTATQQIDLKPVYSYGSFTNIPGDSSAACIIALPKFTLPDSKYLSIKILEKNGARNLNLILKNRHIMNAKIISDIN